MTNQKAKTNLIVAIVALFLTLAMTVTTTFAWFTMSVTPKVASINMEVTTADTDLWISVHNGVLLYEKGDVVTNPTHRTSYEELLNEEGGVYTATQNIYTVEGWTTPSASITQAMIAEKLNGIYLTNCTTENAIALAAGNFTGIDGTTSVSANNKVDTEGGYAMIEFKFTSTTNYNIILNQVEKALVGNTVVSEGDSWISDKAITAWKTIGANAYGTGSPTVTEGNKIPARAANAARVGFVSGGVAKVWEPNNATGFSTNSFTAPTFIAATGNFDQDDTPILYTTNDYRTTRIVDTSTFNASTPIGSYFIIDEDAINGNLAWEYQQYLYQSQNSDLPTFKQPIANTIVGGMDNLVPANPATVLASMTGTVATGYETTLTVYIWLEGWDGDCFNSILEDNLKVDLQFKGVKA